LAGYAARQLFVSPRTRRDDVAHRLCRRIAGSVQKKIRFPDLKLFEKNFIQLIIVVLTCVNEDMICMGIELMDHPAQLDDLRPCPDNCHYLESHVLIFPSYIE
jgi:hypothetical protein